ncbi:MAG: DRTGG domain-containing protein [Christensenellales bacterium]|jgi:hypothetical protein
MELSCLIDNLNAEILNMGTQMRIRGGYCCDLLSNVISKAPSGCAWYTVMNNVNVAGVALLAEVGAVVLCEGVKPATDLLQRCRENGITLLATSLDVYSAARAGECGSENIL